MQLEYGIGLVMLQVDGIGFAVGPPAPARLMIGLAKSGIESRLKRKMIRCIVQLRVPLGCLLNIVLAGITVFYLCMDS